MSEKKDISLAYSEYVDFLKEKGVDTTAPHWKTRGKVNWRQLERKLIKLFRDNMVLDGGDELHKYCSVDKCANPLHYTVVKIATMEQLEVTDVNEVEELSELIDPKLLKRLGFKGYFKLFNEGTPLPAKVKDFYIACNVALRRHNMRLLPITDLVGKLRRNKVVTSKSIGRERCTDIQKAIEENYLENEI